jgi:hypothetical protein
MKLDTTIKINPKCYHLYVFPTKETETQKYLDYLNGYISQILEHIYGGSSIKFICITGISFYVYRLSKTGSKIVGMEKYTKTQKTYTVVYLVNICVFLECIYTAVYKNEYKALKGNTRNIVTKLKKFYNELFNKSFPVNFDGLDTVKTLEHAAKKYNIKFIIYSNDENDRLCHLNTIGTSKNIHNLLMISGPDEKIANNNSSNNNSKNISSNNTNVITHVMYIKDIQKYTKLHICPNTYKKERFEEHVNNCEGKILRSICLNEQSIPFIPHIQKNSVYAYLLAHNCSNEY